MKLTRLPCGISSVSCGISKVAIHSSDPGKEEARVLRITMDMDITMEE